MLQLPWNTWPLSNVRGLSIKNQNKNKNKAHTERKWLADCWGKLWTNLPVLLILKNYAKIHKSSWLSATCTKAFFTYLCITYASSLAKSSSSCREHPKLPHPLMGQAEQCCGYLSSHTRMGEETIYTPSTYTSTATYTQRPAWSANIS